MDSYLVDQLPSSLCFPYFPEVRVIGMFGQIWDNESTQQNKNI